MCMDSLGLCLGFLRPSKKRLRTTPFLVKPFLPGISAPLGRAYGLYVFRARECKGSRLFPTAVTPKGLWTELSDFIAWASRLGLRGLGLRGLGY